MVRGRGRERERRCGLGFKLTPTAVRATGRKGVLSLAGATVTTLLVLVLEAPFGVSGTTGPDGLPDGLTRIDVVGTTGVVDRCASEPDSGSKSE